MARAARQISIDPNEVQIVHVFNRCVRRAFLCGQDPLTGRNYEHRRQWARDRLEHLAGIFAVDCITFSIMSNHTHQILRSRPDIVASWDDRAVAIRWLSITPNRDASGNVLPPTEAQISIIAGNPQRLAQIRSRLSDVSWWMRYFSHHMAVRSNQEDESSGHFWEARFGSEVLASESSVLACMIYVDLNPVRAQMAATPEESDYTGAKDRIDDLRISLGTTELGQTTISLASSQVSSRQWERLECERNEHSGWMCPIEIDEACDPIGVDAETSGRRASRKGAVAISLPCYLQLLDWAGRRVRGDKRGAIAGDLVPILARIGITGDELLASFASFGSPPGCLSVYLDPAPPPANSVLASPVHV